MKLHSMMSILVYLYKLCEIEEVWFRKKIKISLHYGTEWIVTTSCDSVDDMVKKNCQP